MEYRLATLTEGAIKFKSCTGPLTPTKKEVLYGNCFILNYFLPLKVEKSYMTTIFTKIMNGEIPCHKIYEDEKYFAFLDIRPINTGHTLCIPKEETDYIFDLDDDVLSGLAVFSKKIAAALKKSVACKRVGVMVLGLEVPHTHIHLVPINSQGDLSFDNAKEADQEELAKLAEKIRGEL